jgi:UDP-glucose 4-epimerase
MRILITGALGFVGINLVRTLAAKPATTVVAADLHDPDERAQRFLAPVAAHVGFARLDVTDRAAFAALVEHADITHVIHGAAVTPSLDEERKRTTKIVDINLGGMLNALDATVRHSSVARLIFLSSSGVYGLSGQRASGTIGEDAPLELDNLYAITKRSGELLAMRYASLHDKPIASVRLGPIYGPMERTTASRPRLSAPGQLLGALRAGRSISVAGREVVRDWTYAGDVGEALWALLKAPIWRHGVYNLSYGKSVRLGELVDAFVEQGLDASWCEDVKEADVKMQPEQTRTSMSVARLLADSGYAPTSSPSDGVARSVALEELHATR